MKNVNAYNEAIMVGSNWVATPFVLNYGVDTVGCEDDYIDFDIDVGDYLNYFGTTKVEYRKYIRKVASPDFYGASFRCGDMGYAKYGAPNKQKNMVQLLFADSCLKIAAFWMDGDNVPKTSDYSLIGLVHFDKKSFKRVVKSPILVTCDLMLFKYTMNMFEDMLYLRFGKNFGKSFQYDGVIRFDSGKDDETDRFEEFSVVKCVVKLNEELAISCINKIRLINSLELYE